MCTKNELERLLKKIVIIYRNIYGQNLCDIYLYGSYARGDYNTESDIDIVAIVKGERQELQNQLKKIWDIISDLELDYGVIISPTVIPYSEFEIYKDILPYYRNIAQEGMSIMGPLFIKKIQIDWDRISGDSYLRNIQALQHINEIVLEKPVTFFVGENGTGKSTLLEAVAVAYGFNPEGGSINYNFSTYDSHSELCDALTLFRGVAKKRGGYFLRAESFYNVATKEMEYADINHPSMKLHQQSHGESFLTIIQKRLSDAGLYILDEPEAALSPQRQLSFLIQMKEAVTAGAQFIIVSHSPILLGYPEADIFSFDTGRLEKISYEETDSYQVTEMFINNREYLLERLFGTSD